MKFQLEIIPVYDAWKENSGCPLCSLMSRMEKKHVEYFLGNSVMNPETRVEVNKTGFCPKHFSMLPEAGHPHHLGLICHTHIQQRKKEIEKKLSALKRNTSVKTVSDFNKFITISTDSCMICDSLKTDIQRYTYTAVILFFREKEFRDLFINSSSLCIRHISDLLVTASEILKKKELKEFINAAADTAVKQMNLLENEILNYTRVFDPQYDGMDLKNNSSAHKKVIEFLSGIKL